MRKVVNLALVVFCGIVGGWVGYWIGYAAGWSEDADWPWTIGGGAGAILLSIALAVLFVLIASALVFTVPQRGVKRVLASGERGVATVLNAEQTGAHRRTGRGMQHQVSCDLEVCPAGEAPYRARVTQFVDEGLRGSLRPGATVAVRYDPARPAQVAIEGPADPHPQA